MSKLEQFSKGVRRSDVSLYAITSVSLGLHGFVIMHLHLAGIIKLQHPSEFELLLVALIAFVVLMPIGRGIISILIGDTA